jgi:signal transduction histidine kinase
VLRVGGTGLEDHRAVLAPAECWPVGYQGELLAVLAVTTPRGVALTRRERRLLDELSHHAGLLVANARLTVDLARELELVQARAAELQRSRQEVVAAQDSRRRRLERDIHDGAQQQLVVMLILLRSLSRRAETVGVPGSRIDDVRGTLRAAFETLSRLSSGHAPLVLVQQGLEAALRDAAVAVGSLGPQVRVHVAAWQPLGVERETAVYFCCLEALQNAVKHAAATRVEITVRVDGGQLELTVTDDGRGFDTDVPSEGSGLADLGSRLVLLGGRVDVTSSRGRGTTVRGVLPLDDVDRPAGARDRPVGAPS